MITFKKWLENYEDIDPEIESEKIQNINRTAGLPLSKDANNNQRQINNLTRGFHIDTIVGRMMQRWVVGLRFAPINFNLLQTDPEKASQFRTSNSDPSANKKYKAAYELFKQEIANAIRNLPYKTGVNIHTGENEDVLSKSKDFLSGYLPENKDFIQSLRSAFQIHTNVFGADPKRNYDQIRNFIDFLKIVKDEFMRIGEQLPTLGTPESQERMSSDSYLMKAISKEIEKYNKMLNL